MHLRPAEIGDRGILVALDDYGSVALLAIQIGDDEQAYLFGDWRCVADLVEAFAGQLVEIVEGQGSSWGAHDIRQVI